MISVGGVAVSQDSQPALRIDDALAVVDESELIVSGAADEVEEVATTIDEDEDGDELIGVARSSTGSPMDGKICTRDAPNFSKKEKGICYNQPEFELEVKSCVCVGLNDYVEGTVAVIDFFWSCQTPSIVCPDGTVNNPQPYSVSRQAEAPYRLDGTSTSSEQNQNETIVNRKEFETTGGHNHGHDSHDDIAKNDKSSKSIKSIKSNMRKGTPANMQAAASTPVTGWKVAYKGVAISGGAVALVVVAAAAAVATRKRMANVGYATPEETAPMFGIKY
jgi:hypothetical protein